MTGGRCSEMRRRFQGDGLGEPTGSRCTASSTTRTRPGSHRICGARTGRINSPVVIRRLWILLIVAGAAGAAALPAGVQFLPGPVNGLLVNGKVLVYGDPSAGVKGARYVLFTEARRDVVWAGAPALAGGAAAIVPERERSLFETPGAFWAAYETTRFHDYAQVNTRVLREPVRCRAQCTEGRHSISMECAWR